MRLLDTKYRATYMHRTSNSTSIMGFKMRNQHEEMEKKPEPSEVSIILPFFKHLNTWNRRSGRVLKEKPFRLVLLNANKNSQGFLNQSFHGMRRISSSRGQQHRDHLLVGSICSPEAFLERDYVLCFVEIEGLFAIPAYPFSSR